jgi:uncharacterized phage protein gp47/JayE
MQIMIIWELYGVRYLGLLEKQKTDELVFSDTIYTYNLYTRFVASIDGLNGTTYSGATDFQLDVDFTLNTDDYDRHRIVWTQTGKKPIDGSTFSVIYTPLSVDIPIICLQSGVEGNVAKYQISEAATLPAGLSSVLNYDAVTGGTDIETDEELRNRVPLYLSSLARGTRNSLRFAALSVDGVKFADVVEPYPPQGYVTVIIDDGSGGASDALISAVRDAIDGTEGGVDTGTKEAYRAAGIVANITAPSIVYIDMEGVVYYDPTLYSSTEVLTSVRQNISTELMKLEIGEKVIRAKIIEVIMGSNGVLNLDLTTLRINNTLEGDIEVGQGDVVRPGALSFKALMNKIIEQPQ